MYTTHFSSDNNVINLFASAIYKLLLLPSLDIFVFTIFGLEMENHLWRRCISFDILPYFWYKCFDT